MPGVHFGYAKGWQEIRRLIQEEGRSFSGRERHCFFLNVGGQRFAQASSVTGLDYIDDGRASAVVDWDHDGDLDLWVTNRTGPRVRYLQNEAGDNGNFVAFFLQGVTSNRDAIGARVEIRLADDPRKHIRTLHAGDGFLSQSSKWVHFGLGSAKNVERLIIRWPGGKTQQFSDLEVNRHYRVRQGEAIEPWSPGRDGVTLVPAKLVAPPEVTRARVVLAPKIGMPKLPLKTLSGNRFPYGTAYFE